MSTDAIASTPTTTSNANLTLQDFLQVLMTQLSYQDPLKPMDNQEFMAQIAQFTSLQQTQDINNNVQSLLSGQASQQSIGLMGRTVAFTSSSGPSSGTVTGIDLSGGTPQLSIKTSTTTVTGVTLGQISSIQS
jgi:flagellar basal-body rod modification protein FlgD